MTFLPQDEYEHLSPDAQAQIDALCDEFEACLRARPSVRIEDFVERIDLSSRASLLRELIAVDLQFRRGSGPVQPNADNMESISSSVGTVREAFQVAEPPIEPGSTIGNFRIERQLGVGGMGVVYEAIDGTLGRTVALKVLPRGLGMTSTAVARFHREAQAASKLHHTNIVAIYAEGEADGTCYYAMELIEGRGLDEIIAERRDARAADALSSDGGNSHFDAIACWMADAADALHYAHSEGVVHRDVKPSNLMEDRDHRIKLTDFGLARMLQQPGITISGEFLGTPRYMSPEQIVASRDGVDHRTDVYSLGATLYELLALQPPFTGTHREEVFAAILHQEPRRPRHIDKRVPLDLETICLKALEKDPAGRYASAGEMANDLRRHVNHYTISAKRVGPVGRTIKWARRRPAVAALAGGVLLVAAVAGTLAYRLHAARQDQIAVEQEQLVERRQHVREMGVLEAMSGNFGAAEALVDEAERLGESRGWVHMLRGQLAIYRGDHLEAIRLLKQATHEMPDSAAAYAMLTHARFMVHEAYGVYESYGAYQERIRQLARFELVTPEDYLFAGQALGFVDPGIGARLVNEAIRHRKSALGYVISAEIGSFLGWVSGDIEIAERAVRHASIAQEELSNHPRACAMRVWAHLMAASVYRYHEQHDAADRHLANAGEAARAVDAVHDRASSVDRLYRGWYFDYVDDADAALEVYRPEVGNGPTLANKLCLYVLYRQGRYEEALQVADQALERVEGDSLEVSRIYAIAEAKGPEQARQALQDLVQRARAQPSLPYYPTLHYGDALRVLGRNEAADELMAQLGKMMRPNPAQEASAAEYFRELLKFSCGEISAGQLLATAGSSPAIHADAHYYIGVRKLGEGDRDAARDHFRVAKRLGTPPTFEWYWSWAFLKQLENNPSWPPWIESGT